MLSKTNFILISIEEMTVKSPYGTFHRHLYLYMLRKLNIYKNYALIVGDCSSNNITGDTCLSENLALNQIDSVYFLRQEMNPTVKDT